VIHQSIPALHALTNDVILADPTFVASATAVMRGCRSRVAIHLRGTETKTFRMLELALELRVIAEQTGSWVLITDRVDVAMVSGVTGAQLTSRSLAIADARRIAPTLTLGASVHTASEAWLTAQSGASFLVASTDADATPHIDGDNTFLRELIDAADSCPVVSVGGMTPTRVHRAVAAGARGIAAMRGVWLDDAVSSANRYLAAYDEALRR
jgi:thiazole tautomerase (transcriptional regulator TenI)